MQYDRKNPDLGMQFMTDSMVKLCGKMTTSKDFKSGGIAPSELEKY
jgi:hypothetical protein